MTLALRTLEFDRIVEVVTGLALTPLGERELAELQPEIDPTAVANALNATTETTTFFETNPLFPLRAGGGIEAALDVLNGRGTTARSAAASLGG